MKPRIGDKLVFVPKDRENLKLQGKGDIPQNHEVIEVSGIRLYEKIGFCISLKDYDPSLFFPIKYFKEPDLSFADQIIQNL